MCIYSFLKKNNKKINFSFLVFSVLCINLQKEKTMLIVVGTVVLDVVSPNYSQV